MDGTRRLNKDTMAEKGPLTTLSIATEFVPCDLCGSEDQELLYTRTDPITKDDYHLVECGCGMAFVNPMPTREAIADLYPRDYLKDKSDMSSMYRRMMKLLPQSDGDRLLDLGCGRGDFIHYAAGYGWDVEGVDLIEWNTPHHVPIRVGDFVEMDLPERHYDVVTAWALLEHVRKPSQFFEKVSRILKDDGRFVFIVPNFSAPGMRMSCTEDVPRHLHLFTPKAVEGYLDRFGMMAVTIHHRADIYTAYPFGLLRYGLLRLLQRETRCTRYQNRSVSVLRNRQIKGNLQAWLGEVVRVVGPVDILLDAVDLCLGVIVANFSKIIRNYGVMTVTARKRTAN
ncbi:MAG: class I SAM-dependent methyltransferase [Deltaproteobacteria bacterium]|nr:class I SAM-dependent methyltransferase [Deltaproteobacteria bacterium]